MAHSYKYCPTAATWHCVNEGYLMETDYLVIGAGAMGLAFVDAIHTFLIGAKSTSASF